MAAGTGDIDKVRHAAERACVDDSIMAFADGYDTLVGERGVTLSGGQKQRVALARTFMTHSPIMVFDDSMSNLDMQTDEKIRRTLRNSAGNATVIIISHRINTLMTADNIIVLSEGKIVQSGSHQQLLKQDGIYRRTYEIQRGNGGDDDA
jgi:ATP-binding cassette subfamily B protein